MKVCLLNESFPPVIDGVVNVLLNYADYMRKDFGAQIAVGTPCYPNADYSKYPYQVIPYQSFDTAALASGYRAGNPFEEKSVQQLAAFQPDIIHSHCPASATVVARLVREETKAPIVFTYHTKYDIDIERWVRVRAIAQEGIKAYVSNIEACDEVWAVSRGAGESLKALGFQGDYRVMNNGVDFAKGRVDAADVNAVTGGYDLPEGVPMFLFVGRIITYKGLPLILDALKTVAEKGQDFRMVFIGKGPDEEKMKEKAAALGIGDKCIFVGPVYDREKLRAWNTRADLFLFPSTFDTNGLVVREAAACGLASVLIKGSCAAEGVTDDRNGFIIDETPEAMASLLLKVSGDLGHLADVGQHAMDEIYLSWKECVAAAYERYQIILDNKKCGRLPEKKKLPGDYFLTLTARHMEEQERNRRIRREFFNDFKETAVGMMENIQEAGEKMEAEAREEMQESAQKLTSRLAEARAQAQESAQKFSGRIAEAKAEAQEDAQRFSDRIAEAKAQAQENAQKFSDRVAEAEAQGARKLKDFVEKEFGLPEENGLPAALNEPELPGKAEENAGGKNGAV